MADWVATRDSTGGDGTAQVGNFCRLTRTPEHHKTRPDSGRDGPNHHGMEEATGSNPVSAT